MAANPLGVRPYLAVLITIAAKTNLAAAIKAAYAALTPSQEIAIPTASHLILYAPITNGATVYIGDAALSTTNFGDQLPTSTATFRSVVQYGPFMMSKVPVSDIWVIPSDGTTSTTVGVQLIAG